MDIEELKKALDTDEGKLLVAGLISTATDGLTTKNTQLLAEVKELRSKPSKSTEELEELERKAKIADDIERKSLESKGEYEKLMQKSKEQHDEEVGKLTSRAEKAEKVAHEMLVEGNLAKELASANVNPALVDAAVKLLADDISVIEVDGKLTASVGDKTVTDYVKGWAEGDVGKNFVLADGNSGGGAGGDGDSKTTTSDAEKFFDPASPSYNMTEQLKFKGENPDEYKRLKEKFPGQSHQPSGPVSAYGRM